MCGKSMPRLTRRWRDGVSIRRPLTGGPQGITTKSVQLKDFLDRVSEIMDDETQRALIWGGECSE